MNKSFGFGVAKLLSSKIAAQAVNFVSAPIISRLFLPEYFGIRQIFLSINSIPVSLSSLRYELSIPLGKDKKESVSSLFLSVFLVAIFSFLSLILVYLFRAKVAEWFRTPELEIFIWLLPLAMFLGGSGNALRFYASKEGRFGVLAVSDFVSVFLGVLANILWAFFVGSSATGLFAGYFIGTALGFLLLSGVLAQDIFSNIKISREEFANIWLLAKRYKKFPIFETWSTLFSSVSLQLPTILMGLYFTQEIVGYYSQGQRLISLPMSMLGGAIAQVFFPIAASDYNEKKDISAIVGSTIRRLIQIGVFPMLTLAFLGAPIFRFFLGQEWHEAGVFAQILSVSILFEFMCSPLSSVYSILHRQGTSMIFNVGSLVFRFLGLFVGVKLGDPKMALIGYSLMSSIFYISVISWIIYSSLVSFKFVIATFFKYLLSVLLILPAFLFSYYRANIIFVVIFLVLGYIAYILILYFTDPFIHGFVSQKLEIKKGLR